jgi:hypothetical protein
VRKEIASGKAAEAAESKLAPEYLRRVRGLATALVAADPRPCLRLSVSDIRKPETQTPETIHCFDKFLRN